ncbi:MAG: hypothetical protein B7Y56_10885 [Gallionellales bacterium 35-53-114]|nr:MAG: hypothetical protein B7Y56_10885 [Gallionellales bacterium 35-53-114]OYZ64873.1 MAG: hypothetical protein B7Y04_03715 [Gallionellales bacterium 24-53-125]OZB07589.1 MAG: hypothetical protein B7X61_13300 [Gallionellales bacterium 39-52-133]
MQQSKGRCASCVVAGTGAFPARHSVVLFAIALIIMTSNTPEIRTLDLEEAAAFLKIHPITLLRLANSGAIPAAKPGKRWVFINIDLTDWLRAQYLPRASEGSLLTERRAKKCHSSDAKTPRYGGLTSPSTGIAYSKLLAQKTNSKRKSSTTD